MITTACIIIFLFIVWLRAVTTHTWILLLDVNWYKPKDYLMIEPTLTILQVVRVGKVKDFCTEYEVISFCGSKYKWINKIKKKWFNFVVLVKPEIV